MWHAEATSGAGGLNELTVSVNEEAFGTGDSRIWMTRGRGGPRNRNYSKDVTTENRDSKRDAKRPGSLAPTVR
jgi:hypothetical protein